MVVVVGAIIVVTAGNGIVLAAILVVRGVTIGVGARATTPMSVMRGTVEIGTRGVVAMREVGVVVVVAAAIGTVEIVGEVELL